VRQRSGIRRKAQRGAAGRADRARDRDVRRAAARAYRVEAGLTQQALAEKARLSEQAIGALERGDRRYPQAVTVDRLVGVLGVDRGAAGAVRAGRVARARPGGAGLRFTTKSYSKPDRRECTTRSTPGWISA
jgi:transcriptional regulator with XRE-family HTH domain